MGAPTGFDVNAMMMTERLCADDKPGHCTLLAHQGHACYHTLSHPHQCD